ncbi:MAG: glycosyltransferase family 87 protein, partial [Stackebrandtia sp.]
LMLFGLGAVAAVYRMRQRRAWDAMLLACAPIMLFTAVVNWDLFAVATTVFFLWAWARRKPVLAGILLGIAVGAKFYPLLIAGPLVVLAWRYRRLPVALTSMAVAGITWLVVNLPFIVFATDGWLRFFELNSERGIDWGTTWYVLRHISGENSTLGTILNNVDVLNLLYLVAFAACCAAIAWVVINAPVPPRLAQVAFLVVAAFLLTGKVWSQQYVLWLLPLLVLARPQWRAFLAWQAAELFYFVAFYGELLQASNGDENSGVPTWALVSPEWIFVLASTARLATVVALCVLVLRDIYHPKLDVVRRSYGFDPDAGPLASDAAVPRSPVLIGR